MIGPGCSWGEEWSFWDPARTWERDWSVARPRVCPHDRVSHLIDAEASRATLSELNPFAADPKLHNQAGLRDVDRTRLRLRHAYRARQGRGLSAASGQTPLSQTQSNGGARPPEQGRFHMLIGFQFPSPRRESPHSRRCRHGIIPAIASPSNSGSIGARSRPFSLRAWRSTRTPRHRVQSADYDAAISQLTALASGQARARRHPGR